VLSSKTLQAELPLARAWGLLRWLLYGAFVAALVALAAVLAAAVMPRAFGYGTLVVQGGSMGHSVPMGSLVIARWTAAQDIEVGDVIVVQEDDEDGPARPKLHRVVSLDGQGDQILVRTKGDANQTADPKEYILPDRVLIPALTAPYLGYVAGFAMTPLGWAFLILLPGTVLALLILRSIWADDDHVVGEETRSRDRPNLPPTTTLPMLLCAAFMIGAIGVGAALGVFVDTASVTGNTFTTAASFP
jgi:signal peptidase I